MPVIRCAACPPARQPAASAWLLAIHAAGIPVPFADASASFRHVDVPWLRSLPHLRQAIKAWQDLAAAGRLPGWVVMQSLWALKIAAMPPPPAWEADCLDQLAWGLVEDLEKGPIPPADWARRLLLSASRLPTPPRSPVWAAVAAIVSQDPPAPGCLEAASDENLARLATLLQGLPLSLKSPSLEALARAIAIDRRLPCGQAGPSRGRM